MESLGYLKNEHRFILKLVCDMDKQLVLLESCKPRQVSRILRTVSELGDTLWEKLREHIRNEEVMFYQVLTANSSMDKEPFQVMKREHVDLLASVLSVRSEIMNMIENNDNFKTWLFASKLQDLRGVLSDHMSREEQVIFWLAELNLPERSLRRPIGPSTLSDPNSRLSFRTS